MKIFLNPGHSPNGCPDPGAVNLGLSIRECDIVSIIGLRVAHLLQEAGCQVSLLQSDNLCGEGEGPNVCECANEFQADLFVSLHCNAADGSARGAEVFCYEDGGEASAAARFILEQLTTSLKSIDYNFPNRGVKEAPDFMVLRHTDMPAVLVEIAFIDNAQDAFLLLNQQEKIARAIARGVTDYWCYTDGAGYWGCNGKEQPE